MNLARVVHDWGHPFLDLRVLDFSRYAPGPFCTRLLAEMGAEVIKVEKPGSGDPLRELDPVAFEELNRGKKSLTLNLDAAEKARVLEPLLATTDVLLEGFRPGVMSGWGLSPETILGRYPGLTYVSLTGYGQGGPCEQKPGHDINYMAAGGALGQQPWPIQVADFAAGGLYSCLAIAVSLLERRRTGRGRHVDLAMLDGVVSFLALAGSTASVLLSGVYPDYSVYGTSDGRYLSVGALEPKFWRAFCRAIGRADLFERQRDRDARKEVASVIERRSLSDWQKVFATVEGCVEPVRLPHEVAHHPQVVHRQRSMDSSLPHAPGLGEHTGSLLAAVGCDAIAIQRLRETGTC